MSDGGVSHNDFELLRVKVDQLVERVSELEGKNRPFGMDMLGAVQIDSATDTQPAEAEYVSVSAVRYHAILSLLHRVGDTILDGYVKTEILDDLGLLTVSDNVGNVVYLKADELSRLPSIVGDNTRAWRGTGVAELLRSIEK